MFEIIAYLLLHFFASLLLQNGFDCVWKKATASLVFVPEGEYLGLFVVGSDLLSSGLLDLRMQW